MDLSRHAQPKPAKGTAQKEKRQRRARLTAQDRAENAIVKARSGGRCEVVMRVDGLSFPVGCPRQATQVHHMLGGRGMRGVGISSRASAKQHVCTSCHQGITGDVGGKTLIRVGGPVPHYTDSYRLVR